jgi:hypothetical protein
MTTVADVDRLVVASDGAVAHYWPRLGPKVRTTYLDDRNRWIAIRSAPDGGAATPASGLETQRRVFSGWVRAFKTMASRPRATKPPARAPAPAGRATAVATASTPTAATTPALATVSHGSSGAGAAVAGGFVLAGLIAVAARRRRA